MYIAHEGKVQHRIANFIKIKVCISSYPIYCTSILLLYQNELTVDDFLAADDPRIVKEGILNLSRL
jgi:hypothetical protein